MKLELWAVAIVLFAGTPTLAHRLDEYLQGTLISVEQNRMNAQMTLTPGVAVFPTLIADIDLDADGVLSETERSVYANQVLHDLAIAIDGHSLTPHLRSVQFPGTDEMKEGLGEIRIEFDADLPSGGPKRKLTFENHHQSRIAAYQVNCLVSRDPDIRILGQNRNYNQSFYELDFEQASVQSSSLSFASMPVAALLLGMPRWPPKTGHRWPPENRPMR
jgi:hypothetical protein